MAEKTDLTFVTSQPDKPSSCVDSGLTGYESHNGRTSQPNDNAQNGESNPKIIIEMQDSEVTELILDENKQKQIEFEQEKSKKVPDGGYGWFIVLGGFISHIIIGSLERGDGIFFLQFHEKFQQSAQLTAWPGALVSTLRLTLGPVASAVCNRYSVRTSCLIGSLIVCLGLILNGFAPNFFFLFFSHALVQGIGRGLVYAPGLFLVGMYFNERRGVATGLSTSGVGVGTFLLVPLYQIFFDTYGYQGAFMVIGALSLNLAVCAMLFRPLSLHYKFTEGKERNEVDKISLQEGLVVANAVEMSDVSSIRSWKAYHNSRQNTNGSIVGVDNDSDDEDEAYRIENDKITSQQKKEGCLKPSLKICFPVEQSNKSNDAKKKLFHFHLLKNLSFFMFCLSIMLFTAAFKSAFTFMPAQVKSLGYSDSEAAMVLSISGVVDTFSRILSGFLFDLPAIRPFRPIIYTGLLFCISIVSLVIPLLKGYAAICLVCSMYGILTGGYVSQKAIITVDILGKENIANSFGLLICFQGIGMSIGPPVSGALKDAYGTYDLAFQFGGAIMIVAGCLMTISNIYLSRQRKQEQQEKEDGCKLRDSR